MFRRLRHPPRRTVAAIVVMLVLVPAAAAGSSQRSTPRSWNAAICHNHQICERPGASGSVPVEVTVSPSADRFQWSSAAIGFGVACGAVLLATGVFLVRRRTRIVDAGILG